MSKANLLHEFKSPINRIRGLAQVLCSDVNLSEADRRAILKLVEANADRLTRSAESLLLHTSWDGKSLEIEEISGIEVAKLVDRVIEESQSFTTNTISLKNHLKTSDSFQMDIRLVHQALDYLLNNASKFVHDGKVEIAVCVNDLELQIVVSDDGPGMRKPHDATRPFWQESSGLSRLKSGLGLGLTVCEKIAQAHSGVLELASRPGAGFTARMRLPVVFS